MDNKSFLVKAGAILIISCILVLVIALSFSFYKRCTRVVDNVTIQFVMPVDSLGIVVPEALQSVEDLKNEIARHEQLLENKYKYMMDQKENMNDLLSIGGMFLAIILGLFGFFGYKSMNSIEEKVEKEAKSIAEETSKSKFESYATSTTNNLTKEFNTKIKETIDKNLALFKKSTKKHLDDTLDEKVRDSLLSIKANDETQTNMPTSTDEQEQKITSLTDRVTKLEIDVRKLEGRRRSLANGGMK